MEQIRNNEIKELCKTIKFLMDKRDYSQSMTLIRKAMADYPSNPEPHNLMGLVYEKQGNHCVAMRHFRAAYALDPSYVPAEENLDKYSAYRPYGPGDYGERYYD